MDSLSKSEVESQLDSRIVVDLLRQFHTFEPGAYDSAAATLLGLPKEPLIDVLSGLVKGIDPELRCDAAYILLKIDAKRAVPLVLPLLADPDSAVRWNTCGLLHDRGDERATEGLVKLLREDPDAGTRHIAAWALGACGDARALPALEVAAATDDGEDYEGRTVSEAAVGALFEIKARFNV